VFSEAQPPFCRYRTEEQRLRMQGRTENRTVTNNCIVYRLDEDETFETKCYDRYGHADWE